MRIETQRLIKQAERDLQNAGKNVGIGAFEVVTARYPDAANGVPYEVYDRDTAEAKVRAAEETMAWLRHLTSA